MHFISKSHSFIDMAKVHAITAFDSITIYHQGGDCTTSIDYDSSLVVAHLSAFSEKVPPFCCYLHPENLWAVDLRKIVAIIPCPTCIKVILENSSFEVPRMAFRYDVLLQGLLPALDLYREHARIAESSWSWRH